MFLLQETSGKMEEDAYIILNKINEGAFGGIFAVHSLADRKIYAMKQISFRGDISCDTYIKNEMKHLTILKHSNIIQLKDIIVREYTVNLIMDFAENGNLEDYILDHKPRDQEICKLFHQIFAAVNFCHFNGIAHRDITPRNILITGDTSVRLADFGLSVLCRDSEGHVIPCDDYLGHLHYSAPEVLKKTPFDPLLADMWSLGVVLYFMIHSNVPFTRDEDNILSQEIEEEMIMHKLSQDNTIDHRPAPFLVIIRNLLRTEPRNRWLTDHVMDFVTKNTTFW